MNGPTTIALLTAYLLGAIPFGFLIGRMKGIDIRLTGSGNIGATNVMRSVGKSWGILTLFLDALKGLLATVLIPMIVTTPPPFWLPIACGCAAVLGHSFPLYLKFKGGKGVATSAGVLIGIAPLPFLVGIAVFLLLLATFRYVSLGSIGAALAVPIAQILLYGPSTISTILAMLALVIIWRHKSNISRLLHGTENRLGSRKAASKADAVAPAAADKETA